MNESFDFNKVRDNKPSIAGVIKKTAITLIEENVLPLFNNLRPDYKERYKFIPEHRFIGNKCELLYQNKVIIDFTFGYDYIEEMNVYDTTNRLAQEIKDSEEYKDYKKYKELVNKDITK